MTVPLPTYTIEQLAPGSYDVLLEGTLVAALVRGIDGLDDGWRVDLLEETLSFDCPPPFTDQSHTIRSLPDALDWLGIHEKSIADAQAG